MDNIKSIIVLLFFWLAAGCTSSEIQKEVSLINQAESLLQSDPHQAHTLLDSVKYPEELSMKQGARWCMLVGKLAGKNIPQQTQSPLNAIDWQNIIALIDMAYPKIFRIISSSRLSEEEGKLCYLSILGFSTADISLLLYTPKSTLYKNRQRAKAKLQIPNNYASLEEYFADLM